MPEKAEHVFRKLTFFHDAHPYGVCGGCKGKFIPDKSSDLSPDRQIREQFNNHECKEEYFGKVVPLGAKQPGNDCKK